MSQYQKLVVNRNTITPAVWKKKSSFCYGHQMCSAPQISLCIQMRPKQTPIFEKSLQRYFHLIIYSNAALLNDTEHLLHWQHPRTSILMLTIYVDHLVLTLQVQTSERNVERRDEQQNYFGENSSSESSHFCLFFNENVLGVFSVGS